MKLRQIPAIIVMIGCILSGCNLAGNREPVNGPQAIFTAAAQTLEAQLTQTAVPDTAEPDTALPDVNGTPALPTPGLPPLATASPLATDTPVTAGTATAAAVTAEPTQPCEAARFITDVTIPDGTKLTVSQSFTKTWRFKNIGTCTWNSSYTLAFDTGDSLGGPASQPLSETVPPGGQVDISVSLQAPSNPGSYRSFWRLRDPSGLFLPVANGYKGKSFYIDIQVKNAGAHSDFTVTNVQFSVSHSGTCSAGIFTVTAKVTTNAGGQVTYTWGRSDGVIEPLSSGTLTFPAAQTQSISYDWASGATGLSMTLYVNNPNHENFGTALLNCP